MSIIFLQLHLCTEIITNNKYFYNWFGSYPIVFRCKNRWISRNAGRSISSRRQHSNIRSYNSLVHRSGRDRIIYIWITVTFTYFHTVSTSSFDTRSILFNTSAFDQSAYGIVTANSNISHRVIANDHTSLLFVYRFCKMCLVWSWNITLITLSIAIHRIGKRHWSLICQYSLTNVSLTAPKLPIFTHKCSSIIQLEIYIYRYTVSTNHTFEWPNRDEHNWSIRDISYRMLYDLQYRFVHQNWNIIDWLR